MNNFSTYKMVDTHTISSNQRIKRIKIFDFLWFFVTHTYYLNEGWWKTDKDDMLLAHMVMILFPVFVQMLQSNNIKLYVTIPDSVRYHFLIKQVWIAKIAIAGVPISWSQDKLCLFFFLSLPIPFDQICTFYILYY